MAHRDGRTSGAEASPSILTQTWNAGKTVCSRIICNEINPFNVLLNITNERDKMKIKTKALALTTLGAFALTYAIVGSNAFADNAPTNPVPAATTPAASPTPTPANTPAVTPVVPPIQPPAGISSPSAGDDQNEAGDVDDESDDVSKSGDNEDGVSISVSADLNATDDLNSGDDNGSNNQNESDNND